jgi:hypothetical protein
MVGVRAAAMLFFLALTTLERAAAINELAGREIRCCVLELAPYVMGDPRCREFGNWSGLAIDVRDVEPLPCAYVGKLAGAGHAQSTAETETLGLCGTRALFISR